MKKAKKFIGIFGIEVSSRIQGNLYTELHRKAKNLGYNIFLLSGTYDKYDFNSTTSVTKELYKIVENMDFSAFIIHVQSIGDVSLVKYLINVGHQKNIPVFAYDCDAVGIIKEDGVITINPDYKQGFAECVRHLIEIHNCKKIYMLAGIKNNKYSDDRVDMYKQEMSAHGLNYTEKMIGYGDFWEIPSRAAVNKFLDEDVPDAICCANDLMAITATKVIEQRGVQSSRGHSCNRF